MQHILDLADAWSWALVPTFELVMVLAGLFIVAHIVIRLIIRWKTSGNPSKNVAALSTLTSGSPRSTLTRETRVPDVRRSVK